MTTAAPSTSAAYDELMRRTREADLLHGTSSVLGWDQEVMMPPRGVDYRSEQLSLLARLHHEMLTDARIGDLLHECSDDDDLMSDPLSPQAVNVRRLRRDYDRRTRLPASLVEEEAKLASVGQHVWAEARRASDFGRFRPTLEKIVALLRRKAECYGWAEDGEPWDALAEDYEPGCTAADVDALFTPLRRRLRGLVQELVGSDTSPSGAFNQVELPIDDQKRFVRFVSEAFGFDYQRGRLDVSTHPFCSGSHCRDVRLTTRFQATNVNDALASTMHETGHGIYEQGLRDDAIGTPLGTAASLGIHESQSRMWENQVGRSRAFWTWCHPHLRRFFGKAVAPFDLDEIYGAANIVAPDLIRVEADEATYNLHIMIRFELERRILRGDLAVADIPDAWNAGYKADLGLDVPDDAKGCLQDIHWSMASMGYFPTYTLGNVYAAQFFEKALEEMPGLEDRFAEGSFSDLKRWLNERIHAHGRRHDPPALCEVVTGRPPSPEPLLRHLEGKLRPLYGVATGGA